jgi:ribulose-5-phosphate 4-epimerase/fuculose-1-phosphate aldolase
MIEEAKIKKKIEGYDFLIQDAQVRLSNAAKMLLARTEAAVKESEELLSCKPFSLHWMYAAEGDLIEAKEAKAELNKLCEMQMLLKHLLKPAS